MKKSIEEIIRENRDCFDDHMPGDKVWKAIADDLPGKRNTGIISKITWLKWAAVAAAIVIVCSSISYFQQPNHSSYINITQVDAAIPEAYEDEVYHFTKLIEIKHKQLQKIEKDHPDLYRQFAADISRLDSNYQVLRKELPGNPNQEVLIEAMIGNLKWQIDLLNEQLNIIQKIKQIKKFSHEKISKPA